MPAYCYYVTSEILQIFKAGYWNASLYALWTRYATTYGPYIEFVIFECGDKPARSCENHIHASLMKWHYEFELFWKTTESTQAFIDAAANVCVDFTTMTDRSPIRNPSIRNPPIKNPCKGRHATFAGLPLISKEEYIEYGVHKLRDTDAGFTNAAMDKYLFVNNILNGSPLAISHEDQAWLFDDCQIDDQHKNIMFHAYNVSRRSPIEIMDKDMRSRPFQNTITKGDEAISQKIKQLVELLELRSCFDTDSIVPKKRIEDNLVEFLKIINSAKMLLNKPSVASAVKDEDVTGDFRRVIRGLNTLFSNWLGIIFANATPRKEKGGSHAKAYKLSYANEFSEKLYTCGLVQ